MMRARRLPSPNTVWVARWYRSQRVQPAASVRNWVRLAIFLNIGRRFFLALFAGIGQIRGMAPPHAETQPADETFVVSELQDAWHILSIEERVEGFRLLPRGDAEEL